MTDEYWEVDGTSIQTNAYNIETLGGRNTPPPLRGDDEEIPHRYGERWLPKVAGSRTISLAMWVVGANPDGSIDKQRRDIFDDNVRKLQSLFWTPGRQFQLKKRFRYAGAMRSATALGEYAGGLEPEMIGRYGAKLVVNVKLADPYFYDDVEVSTNLGASTNVTVLGDAVTHNINVTINGARKTPRVRNNTLGMEFTYNGELLTGARLEAAVREYRATYFPSGGAGQRASASMVHAGDPLWLGLKPGVNAMVVSSATGTGTVVMKHRGAWL